MVSDTMKELVKSKVNLAEYIRKYAPVSPKGTACCPIHQEKQPSLKIYPNQSWWCFGCSNGGDIFDFVMAMDHIGFKEALNKMAYYAGVDLTAYKPKVEKIDKINKVLEQMAKVKTWKEIIKETEALVVIECQLINRRLRKLYAVPVADRDYKTYNEILYLENQFNDISEKADKVADNWNSELQKHKDILTTIKST